MSEPDATLRKLQRLSERLRDADAKADTIRAELREEIARAREAGVTIAAIAKALKVTRQRVQQLLRP
jgi:DNA-directed RNA polymerase specialized sigma subunit